MRQYLIVGHIFTLLLLEAPLAHAAETFTARVVEIVDGDTLRVIRREGGNWILN